MHSHSILVYPFFPSLVHSGFLLSWQNKLYLSFLLVEIHSLINFLILVQSWIFDFLMTYYDVPHCDMWHHTRIIDKPWKIASSTITTAQISKFFHQVSNSFLLLQIPDLHTVQNIPSAPGLLSSMRDPTQPNQKRRHQSLLQCSWISWSHCPIHWPFS